MPQAQAMDVASGRFADSGLIYYTTAGKPHELPINLLPNSQFQQGTIMAELTASPGTFGAYAGSIIGTPAAQTPTLTTSTTGGTIPGGATYYVVYTWRNGVGQTVKSTEASIAVPGTTNTNTITATAPIALPAGAVGINVFVGTVSGTNLFAVASPTNVATATALPASTAGAPPGSSTAIVGVNGQQNPKCILRYSWTTDALGNCYMIDSGYAGGSVGFATHSGTPEPCVDAFFGGIECYLSDLPNLDSAAISAGFGKVIKGALGSAGLFRLT